MGEGVLLGHSLIIIKWTWEFFSQKCAIWPPFAIRHKRLPSIQEK